MVGHIERFNPVVKEFCNRLIVAGKSKMCTIGAAMRKLLHIIFGVLRSKTKFDPTKGVSCTVNI